MKKIIPILFVALLGTMPLRAQVTKEVEVTKTYVPEVGKAVKLPVAPDMTDTVRLRPDIDYSITPLAIATNLSTQPFRPATVTYWEFDRPLPIYLKVGAGAPLNSVADFYVSTQNPGTGYAVGYINHEGLFGKRPDAAGEKQTAWRMYNRLGAAAGKYVGRHKLEGDLNLTNRIYHRYGIPGGAHRIGYNDGTLSVRFGDDFTDLSRTNFDIGIRGGLFSNQDKAPFSTHYRQTDAGFHAAAGRAFSCHSLRIEAGFDGIWHKFDKVNESTHRTLHAGIRYGYHGKTVHFDIGATYYLDVVTDESSSDISSDYLIPSLDLRFDKGRSCFVPFVQIDGSLQTSDFRTLSYLNPYIFAPEPAKSRVDYNLRAGIMGQLAQNKLSYRLYFGFSIVENQRYWYIYTNEMTQSETIHSGFLFETGTQRWGSLNVEIDYRPSSKFLFSGAVHGYLYDNNHARLCSGQPELTARLGGEFRARKISLSLSAEMQSVRTWTLQEKMIDSEGNLTPAMLFRTPISVDLQAAFDWRITSRIGVFVEAHNLCNANLYDWPLYREYGIRATAGVKLQF